MGLDKNPHDPVDIYVDGVHYATGSLVVVDGNWAVRLEEIVVQSSPEILQPPVDEVEEPEDSEEAETEEA